MTAADLPADLPFADLPLSEVPFADLTEAAYARDGSFGGKEEPDEHIDFRRLRVSIGNRPISWKLRHLFAQSGKVFPKGMKLYRDWDIWMIAHAVSVADRGEFATLRYGVVDSVGYEAEFDKALVSTVGMVPEPSLMKNIGGSVQVSANVGLNGSIAMPDAAEADTGLGELNLPVAGGARLGFSSKADFVGKLSFGIWTPKVVATGICSARCEWLFNRSDAPLLNSQVMFQTVLVPSGVEELKFRCRAYALIRSIGFIPIPSRFETCWVNVSTKPVAVF